MKTTQRFLKCYYTVLKEFPQSLPKALTLNLLISESKDLKEKSFRYEQKWLAENLGIPKSTMARTLKALAADGYISYQDVHFGQRSMMHSTQFTIGQRTIDLFRNSEKATEAPTQKTTSAQTIVKPASKPHKAATTTAISEAQKQQLLRDIELAPVGITKNRLINKALKLNLIKLSHNGTILPQ